MVDFNIPTIDDFRAGGKFYRIKHLSLKCDIPLPILINVFPNYNILEKNSLKAKHLQNIKTLCVQLKLEAQKEERKLLLERRKEWEAKKLEEQILRRYEQKMREHYDTYYRNLYANKRCSCTNVET